MKKLYFSFTLLLMLICGLQSIQATTVYYSNPNNWSKVYCYVYTSSGKNAEWPGAAMTYDATITHDGVTGWWKYDVPADFASGSLLVNDGNGNQYPGAKQPGLLLSGKKSAWLKGTTLTESDEAYSGSTGGTVSEDVYIYFQNKKNYEKVYCYLYIDKKANTTWPGLEMTLDNSIEHDGTTGWYTVKVPEGYTNASFVINNGKEGVTLNGETVYNESTTTSISRINTSVKDPNAWYTITGMKVSAPTKAGLYIHNGKKVIVVK